MDFAFEDKNCSRLYAKAIGVREYPKGVVEAFFQAISIIEAAKDIRDLYAFRAFRVKKLKGSKWKRGERSLRLNKQYRLIFILERGERGPYILVVGITDYH